MFPLWLDDCRNPAKFGFPNYTWAKTAEEAIALLRTGEVCYASLDHDLTAEQMKGGMFGEIREDGQASGYDVVVWLEQHPEYWPRDGVTVHSMNPAGRARMQQVIDRFYRKPSDYEAVVKDLKRPLVESA
jgi:hypothetical protein